MFYFHKKKLTHGQKWRAAIIVVEIVVLFLAIFLSRVQTASPVESIAQIAVENSVSDTNVSQEVVYLPAAGDASIHHLAFYIDTRSRVRIFDNGVIQEFAQFEACPVQMILSPAEDASVNSPRRGAVHISLATIKQGIMVDASSYDVVVKSSIVTLYTSDNGTYQIALDCGATASRVVRSG